MPRAHRRAGRRAARRTSVRRRKASGRRSASPTRSLRWRAPSARRGPYEFKVGTHHARILVSDGSGPGELAYYLTVDGQPAASAAPPAGPAVDMSARAVLVKARATGAGWLTWIGIFSGINSVLAIGGSSVSFVTGLALTYFIDGAFLAATKSKDVPAVATL